MSLSVGSPDESTDYYSELQAVRLRPYSPAGVAATVTAPLIEDFGRSWAVGRRQVAEHRAGAAPRTLAEKLNHLVDVVHPPDRGPFTLEELVAGIRASGGSVSRANLNSLRLGRRDNPSRSTLEDLARFFGVSVSYLVDDPHPEVTPDEHELLLIIRRAEIHGLIREIGRLRPETRQALDRVVVNLREMHSAEHRDHPS